MLGWSFAMAGWVTFMIIALVTGLLASFARDEVGRNILGSGILLPGLVGLALSCGSLDRRAGNPAVVWIALGWNIVLAVIWVGFMVVGLTLDH
jgi:hypothetical protein